MAQSYQEALSYSTRWLDTIKKKSITLEEGKQIVTSKLPVVISVLKLGLTLPRMRSTILLYRPSRKGMIYP